jgi:hypothetical protein
VTDAEFSAAKTAAAGDWAKRSIESYWLDADTYGTDVQTDRNAFATVTAAKVRDFAAWVARQPSVTVLVSSPK